MNRRIRQVGIALLIVFGVIAGQLTYLQVVAADRLAHHPGNVRQVLRTYAEPRGPIVTAGEQIVAESQATNDEFRYRRQDPTGALFGHISGMFSFTYGATGVEATYNDDLSGRSDRLQFRNLGDLLIGKEHTGTVVLSLRADAQEAARKALAGRRGSVVALDPTTGAILAMYSEPSYDPGPLAAHDQSKVRQYYQSLHPDSSDSPLIPAAWRKRYPPGSTFKIITASTAIEKGVATTDSQYPRLKELQLPLTVNTLKNFGGETCGGSLVDSFRESCNTTFGQVGLDLGPKLVDGMRAFGIGDRIPLDLQPKPAKSEGPDALENFGPFERAKPQYAFAGIGQGVVDVTPLQMALVASAIANGGVMMQPHVAAEIRDVDGNVVQRIRPQVWKRAVSTKTAATVRDMMIQVVQRGTGTRAQIPGVTVAGKTGTAQPGTNAGPPHTWFVAFAPADHPKVAVAVVVEHGGSLSSESTGGRVAAPIAKTMIETLLKEPSS